MVDKTSLSGAFNAVFVKYFNNPYYKFFKYSGVTGTEITDNVKALNYTDTKSMYGATVAKFYVKKLDNSLPYYRGWILSNLMGITNADTRAWYLDALLRENGVTNVDFKNYIVLLNPSAHHIDNANIERYPYFQTAVTDTSALFGGENSHLIISGDVIYHYMSDDPYPIPEGEVDIKEGRYYIDEG